MTRDPGGTANAKHELAVSLARAVNASVYVTRGRPISAAAMGHAYRNRTWGDHSRFYMGAPLQTPADALALVESNLRPFLADHVETATDRVGNGLLMLLGGEGRFDTPTVREFGEFLVHGAVKLGATRVVDLLLGWTAGEPLRFRWCAILDGVTIAGPLGLDEGVRLDKLPSSSADLPVSLPDYGLLAEDLLGGVVLSVDCEMTPSLYVPQDGGPPTGLDHPVTVASNRIPKLSPNSFCESMSLACGGWVDWWRAWRDYGELEAFSSVSSGVSLRQRAGDGWTAFTQEDLDKAREIHLVRHGRGSGGNRKELDQAISRWMKSKRASAASDGLIELRIALEALYGKGARNEKAFRVSTYGAWHLGETVDERRQVRETLRKAYDDASRAIHADELKHTKRDEELLSAAQAYCLRGILKRLAEPAAPAWDELILG
ncbi:MAG: hypothetical protein OXI45_05850 [Acidobacteriota bacterium]|nr:hypothetical protein [Acidobacteriota bacterium]